MLQPRLIGGKPGTEEKRIGKAILTRCYIQTSIDTIASRSRRW